ncbi:MAG: 7-cyano-7-deazaguanine synthase QueC [Robiginitomaculum sp.]|nr:7-cyano-7-deazaguanine synthase QueC [Robiginitomaculum sp.]MDQ7077176.1 7-cyano-7-deazaguanine synthase QueC [Robiginitomaculum sp.]
MQKNNHALVLFSGGQDSALCLVWALKRFDHVETIGFDYGQRHHVELQVRQTFLSKIKTAQPAISKNLGEDHCMDLTGFGAVADCSLTRERAIVFSENGLPDTFVPGRNLMFFTAAAALGYRRNLMHLVGGMCETDYSGYPDCRQNTLDAMQETLRLGMEAPFTIHTPLMHLDKAQSWQMGLDMGGQDLIDLMIEHTHTCYLGTRDTRHDWGYGCGTCPACDLRAKGWTQWKSGS